MGLTCNFTMGICLKFNFYNEMCNSSNEIQMCLTCTVRHN